MSIPGAHAGDIAATLAACGIVVTGHCELTSPKTTYVLGDVRVSRLDDLFALARARDRTTVGEVVNGYLDADDHVRIGEVRGGQVDAAGRVRIGHIAGGDVYLSGRARAGRVSGGRVITYGANDVAHVDAGGHVTAKRGSITVGVLRGGLVVLDDACARVREARIGSVVWLVRGAKAVIDRLEAGAYIAPHAAIRRDESSGQWRIDALEKMYVHVRAAKVALHRAGDTP